MIHSKQESFEDMFSDHDCFDKLWRFVAALAREGDKEARDDLVATYRRYDVMAWRRKEALRYILTEAGMRDSYPQDRPDRQDRFEAFLEESHAYTFYTPDEIDELVCLVATMAQEGAVEAAEEAKNEIVDTYRRLEEAAWRREEAARLRVEAEGDVV